MATTASGRKPRGGIPEPLPRRPEFEHLSLHDLRTYRQNLTNEETRVSYWRRLLQARLDVLSAGVPGRRAAGVDEEWLRRLRTVLVQARPGNRGAFIPVDNEPPAPMPALAGLWEREVSLDDEEQVMGLRQHLVTAELELSSYRAALHVQIGAATDELIARYRDEPTLCLSLLPLTPPSPRPC
jgi:hypothetical protein